MNNKVDAARFGGENLTRRWIKNLNTEIIMKNIRIKCSKYTEYYICSSTVVTRAIIIIIMRKKCRLLYIHIIIQVYNISVEYWKMVKMDMAINIKINDCLKLFILCKCNVLTLSWRM